jgi:rSAM/selenodomain-associated transferase 1
VPGDIVPVCIFAKPPAAGRVKTRLIRKIGAEAAAALAAAMLADVWETVSACPRLRPVLAAAEPGSFPQSIPEEDIWLQCAGSLGERLENIFERALRTAPAAMALGADSPLLAPAHLDEALGVLESYDAAIGPCTDGGFYVLALKRCPRGLLRDLPWSSEHTFAATWERLHACGLSVECATPLFDVDTPEDLALLVSALEEMPGLAPATRACLRKFSCW